MTPDLGGEAAPTPLRGYWDRLAPPPVLAAELAAPLAGAGHAVEDRTFGVHRDPLRAGYVGLLTGVLLVAAAVNRAGSRWYFIGAATAVLLAAAYVWWWRSRFAARRVELLNGGTTLAVGMPRGTIQVAVASLITIDQDASPIAQLLGWPELTLHHTGGQLRIARPHDAREFFWHLGRSNPAVRAEPPRTQQRPWIVAIAVGLILLGVLFSTVLAAVAAGQSSTRPFGLTLLAICVVRVWLCIRLWTGSRRAWRILTALALAGVAIGLTSTHVNVASLAAEVVVLCVLTSPGIRSWANN